LKSPIDILKALGLHEYVRILDLMRKMERLEREARKADLWWYNNTFKAVIKKKLPGR
jgi:hypothetical protein